MYDWCTRLSDRLVWRRGSHAPHRSTVFSGAFGTSREGSKAVPSSPRRSGPSHLARYSGSIESTVGRVATQFGPYDGRAQSASAVALTLGYAESVGDDSRSMLIPITATSSPRLTACNANRSTSTPAATQTRTSPSGGTTTVTASKSAARRSRTAGRSSSRKSVALGVPSFRRSAGKQSVELFEERRCEPDDERHYVPLRRSSSFSSLARVKTI